MLNIIWFEIYDWIERKGEEKKTVENKIVTETIYMCIVFLFVYNNSLFFRYSLYFGISNGDKVDP